MSFVFVKEYIFNRKNILAAGLVWSFVVTLIILLIMNRIPGLKLVTTVDVEMEGIDCDQFNEYTHDYIEFQRDLYSTEIPSINNSVTVITMDNQNGIHTQNDVNMIKINSIPVVPDT
jgi:ABC-type transporter Mla maintaining outer membrane lipid asymmetry permease subunit MlaE